MDDCGKEESGLHEKGDGRNIYNETENDIHTHTYTYTHPDHQKKEI